MSSIDSTSSGNTICCEDDNRIVIIQNKILVIGLKLTKKVETFSYILKKKDITYWCNKQQKIQAIYINKVKTIILG